MAKGLFVAGTDTEVGKTLVCAALLAGLREKGLTTAAVKPVAAGAVMTPEGARNEDGLMLQQWQTAQLSYQQVNPVLLREPLSPHIAAVIEGRRVSASQLEGFCRGVMTERVDRVLIEGAGGWRVPINDREYLSALPKALELPVVLVVGMRLGCLNHALLSAEAILADGLQLVGWIANQIDPAMAQLDANLATLQARLPGPFMGAIPWLDRVDPDSAAAYLDLSPLLS